MGNVKVQAYYGYGIFSKSLPIFDQQILRLTRYIIEKDWYPFSQYYDEAVVFFHHDGYIVVSIEYDYPRKQCFSRKALYIDTEDRYRDRVGRYLKKLLLPYEWAFNKIIEEELRREVVSELLEGDCE